MWDSDRIFGGLRLDQEYAEGEPFVLDAIEIIAEDVAIDNDSANLATKTQLTTRKLDGDGNLQPGEPLIVGTFASAIADKAKQCEDGDLPAVVEMRIIPSKTAGRNDARVIQFVRAWQEPKVPASASEKRTKKTDPPPF